mmetsp:Transcript_35500/g.84942  ORF Transcript_35500/g.84942 Transcript_35500/m.84942 type:complete len:210 (+) Transcript_35500:224-853(+)
MLHLIVHGHRHALGLRGVDGRSDRCGGAGRGGCDSWCCMDAGMGRHQCNFIHDHAYQLGYLPSGGGRDGRRHALLDGRAAAGTDGPRTHSPLALPTHPLGSPLLAIVVVVIVVEVVDGVVDRPRLPVAAQPDPRGWFVLEIVDELCVVLALLHFRGARVTVQHSVTSPAQRGVSWTLTRADEPVKVRLHGHARPACVREHLDVAQTLSC